MMKKYVFRIIVITLVILLGTHYSSFVEAKNETNKSNKKNTTTQDTDITIDTDITSNEFTQEFSPHGEVPEMAISFINPIINISNKIFGILQIFGGLLTIVSIAFLGFNKILSADADFTGEFGMHNPHRQIKLVKVMRGIVIGAIILFTSSTIVRIIFDVFLYR